jgi:predicted small lipoprotein YifL
MVINRIEITTKGEDMKTYTHILIALIILALMVSACGGSGPVPTKPPENAAATAQQLATQPQATETTQPQPTATPLPVPTSTPAPTATPKPAEAGTSRSNPLPLGTEFTGETWSIIVSDVIRGQDAVEAVKKANMFNDPPSQGFEYLIANVKIKNISKQQEAQSASFAVDLRVTGDNNIVYGPASVVPPKPFKGELFPDGVAEGQIAFEIPIEEKNLMFIVGEMMSFDTEAMRFITIDPDAKIVPDPSLRNIKPTDIGKNRDNPAKIGDTLIAGSWEFNLVEAIRGDKAAELIKEANKFNEPASEEQEYVLVKLKARYLGGDNPDRGENINGSFLDITGENNVIYEKPSIVPPKPILNATLFAGGATEGWEALSISKDEKGLIVIFEPLFSFSNEEIRYISIE